MAFRIEFTRSAEKDLARLPKDVARRFAKAMDELMRDPKRARVGVDVKKLHGTKTTYRLRVGDYRGIYELTETVVVFTRFAHRSKVYEI